MLSSVSVDVLTSSIVGVPERYVSHSEVVFQRPSLLYVFTFIPYPPK